MDLSVAYDWRGREIRVGTYVLWCNGEWGFGRVIAIYASEYHASPRLDIEWEQREYPNVKDGPGKKVKPKYVTVWPETTTSTSTLIFSGKADD